MAALGMRQKQRLSHLDWKGKIALILGMSL
jgi:outer membrane protease